MQDGKYSDIYFDSDEEEEEASRSGRRNVKSNDELLYDPEKDDEDQVDSFSLVWEYFFQNIYCPTLSGYAVQFYRKECAVL